MMQPLTLLVIVEQTFTAHYNDSKDYGENVFPLGFLILVSF